MAKAQFALKLVSLSGHTDFGNIKLRRGLRVRRRMAGNLRACGPYAVHVYATLSQARAWDSAHCAHGRNGQVWLVSVKNPQPAEGSKLLARAYRVIRQLGTLQDPKTAVACRKLGLA